MAHSPSGENSRVSASNEKTKKDDERARIGKRIKELRLEKGLDAKTLATIAGIDAANLCRIEADKCSVGLDVLSKYH